MPRFYFDVVTPTGVISDHEGTELASLQDARTEAITDARTLMSEAVLRGADISSREIQIRGETGGILLMIPFSRTVRRER